MEAFRTALSELRAGGIVKSWHGGRINHPFRTRKLDANANSCITYRFDYPRQSIGVRTVWFFVSFGGSVASTALSCSKSAIALPVF